MGALDLSTWPEPDRQYVLALGRILSEQDASNISEHLTLASSAPRGPGDTEHLAWPAIISLLMYGQAGISSLRTIALERNSFTAQDSAMTALLCAAQRRADVAENRVRFCARYVDSDAYARLVQKIAATCTDADISSRAQVELADVFRSLILDSSRHASVGSLLATSMIAFARQDGVNDTSDFLFRLIARSSLKITESMLKDLHDLIHTDLPEADYQKFFEEHPALLDPMASEIVPRQALGEMWKTDFVIRRFDDEYLMVEIEKPSDVLFTGYPHPSGSLSHALGQIMNWFVWVEDNIAYAQSHGFPHIHSPKGIVVIGRSNDMSKEQTRMLRLMNDLIGSRIRILTYDDVDQNARNILHNLTTH